MNVYKEEIKSGYQLALQLTIFNLSCNQSKLDVSSIQQIKKGRMIILTTPFISCVRL